jgi:hypothetical protein
MAYAKVTDHDIVQTLTSEELGFKGINVDVDTDGQVVGVEFFLPAPLPFSEWAGESHDLAEQFLHGVELPPEDESVLRSGGQTKQYGPRPRIATAGTIRTLAQERAGVYGFGEEQT